MQLNNQIIIAKVAVLNNTFSTPDTPVQESAMLTIDDSPLPIPTQATLSQMIIRKPHKPRARRIPRQLRVADLANLSQVVRPRGQVLMIRHARLVRAGLQPETRLLGQIAEEGARGIQHVDGVVEEVGALAADAEGPAVLAEAQVVEVGLLLRGRRGPEQAAEGADEREVDLGCEVPEGLQVRGSQPVDEVHGRDQSCFGGGSTDVEEVVVRVGGIQGLHDAPVEGDFGGEIPEVEIA